MSTTVADASDASAAAKRRPTAADGDMSAEELIAHHLRAQTRLRGVVESVEYTSESEGLGSGSIRCLELQQLVPFSCRNISLEKGVVRIAHPGDPCTMKLSCRGQEVRATSIRIKARRPPAPAGPQADAEASPTLRPGSDPVAVPSASQQRLDPVGPSSQGRSPDAAGSSGEGNAPGTGGATEGNSGTHEIFKRDSPLNAFEYQPPADGTHAAGAATGVSAPGSSYGLSPHPAGPPQWPGSLPWSAMEPVTPGQSLQHGGAATGGGPGAMPQHASSPMPPQLPASLQSSPPPPVGPVRGEPTPAQ